MNKLKKIFVLILVLLAFYFSVFFNNYNSEILIRIRLPRFFQGFFTAMALGYSGAILQAVVKNPLADPFIVGISGGALLFSLIARLMNIGFLNPLFYLMVSFGGFLSGILSYLIAKRYADNFSSSILLSGIAVNSFVSAIITFFVIFKKDSLIYFFNFTFGSFNGIELYQILFSSIVILFLFFLSFMLARKMDLIAFNEEKAATLGINLKRDKLILFIISSIACSVSVAMSGMIGFVGLIAPNIARFMFGVKGVNSILYSTLVAILIVSYSDILSRNIMAPIEIPVGVITAFIGAPFFIWLIVRGKNESV